MLRSAHCHTTIIHPGACIMRKLFGFVVLAGALAVSACNTVEGAGRDVSSAGRAVSNAADDAK
jgi:predicted small secreted protein